MKKNIIIFILILGIISVMPMDYNRKRKLTEKMEEKYENKRKKISKLDDVLFVVPSLKFIAAWHFANNNEPISIEQVGEEELINLINKIKFIQLSASMSKAEKKFFINLISNSNISSDNIQMHCLEIINEYPKCLKAADIKTELINLILLKAARDNKSLLANLAISQGANIDIQNNLGDTPLILAIRNNSKNMVSFFLNCGANTNIQNNMGNTALTIAAHYANEHFVKILLEANSNVHIQNCAGRTALMKVAEDGYCKKVAQLLINYGADINIKDNKGLTALMLARRTKYDNIANILF